MNGEHMIWFKRILASVLALGLLGGIQTAPLAMVAALMATSSSLTAGV